MPTQLTMKNWSNQRVVSISALTLHKLLELQTNMRTNKLQAKRKNDNFVNRIRSLDLTHRCLPIQMEYEFGLLKYSTKNQNQWNEAEIFTGNIVQIQMVTFLLSDISTICHVFKDLHSHVYSLHFTSCDLIQSN